MRTTTKFLTTLVMAGAVLSGTAALTAGPAGALPCADCDGGGGGGDDGGVPAPPRQPSRHHRLRAHGLRQHRPAHGDLGPGVAQRRPRHR